MKVKLYVTRSISLFLLFLFFSPFLFAQQVAKSIPNSTSPDGRIGFLQFTPKDYGTQKHPLIIFLHGIGERGNGASQLQTVAYNGIPLYCAQGATMSFTVAGQTSSFVVLSPQLATSYDYWPAYYTQEMIKYAKANLQIDPDRIYVTGLSLGGGGTWAVATNPADPNFDAGIAALAPVCGTNQYDVNSFCSLIGNSHLPVWAFHSMDDGTVSVWNTQQAQSILNSCNMTPAPKFTYYQSGNHSGAWVNAYDTGHITRTTIVNGVATSFTANPNLYEWFLSKTRATGNTAPVANAGAAQTITLPLSTATLTGTGNGTNGATISSYSWAKTSGPAGGVISAPLLNTTLITGLVQGTYVYTLTVTDNHGLTANSSVTITVNPLLNQPPVANAGANTTITLPANSTTLNGSASSDPDGTIATYTWTKTAGPASYTIANAAAATTALSNLVQGVYTFSLLVKDNLGATASSTVTVTVNPAANQPPVANAGAAVSLTLPTNSTTLNGSASSDPDGTIATYAWTKTSGPASYTIANPSSASTALTNLVQGVYVFTLQVTDNAGASASSTVTITVNSAANQQPISYAGANIAITLPVNNTTLNGTGSFDPDGPIAAYAWTKTSGPATYTIADASAATTALTNLVQGIYVFALKVTDNAGATATSSVTVTVNAAANQLPVSYAGANITITLPANSTTLNGTGSFDPDGPIAAYAWTKISGPASYTIANAAGATTALTNLSQGVYIFALQVTDNAGATNSSSVTVTVNAAPLPVNQAPIAYAGANITITLPTNSTSLNGSGSFDPDGGPITAFAWTKTSGPASFNIANPSAAVTSLTGLVQGIYTFKLQVTDNAGATAVASVTVTVNDAALPPPPPVNQAPIAYAGANIIITLPTNSANLNGSGSFDPDGSIATYAWSKTSGPASFNIASAGAASTAITNLTQGVYVFTLQVTDNGGATASSTVSVTVNPAPNQAPVANAGADITITLPINSTDLDGSASYDSDGNIAIYSWNKISGPGAVTITNSNTSKPSVVGLVQGQYVFELTVTDNGGAIATDRVIVTVNPVPNKAPIANAGKDTSILLPSVATVVSGINSKDPDGAITAYSWKQVSGPSTAIIAQPGAAISEISGMQEGDYVFELQVTDNAGATATARVKVSVVNNFRYSEFFKLYPNPAVNTVNLQYIDDKTGKLNVNVYDVNGRMVVSQEFSKEQTLITKQIGVGKLKAGMYYLEVRQSDGKKFIRPFVKQ